MSLQKQLEIRASYTDWRKNALPEIPSHIPIGTHLFNCLQEPKVHLDPKSEQAWQEKLHLIYIIETKADN